MESINKTLNNLSLYEVKAYVRKAQNAVLSLTDMEAKVREATNNEPWGAPSSLMQQIAAGTYNYREREEIINMIFKRFTEKAAHEWRQIYKSLQLLEYIVKNGSEKFVDDVKANVSIIQMLKSFHYIDNEGKDQGINVRNRAKQLVSLLNDDSLIRQERKKARLNLKKYGGVAGGKSSVAPGSRFVSNNSYNGYDDEGDDDDYEYASPGAGFGSHQNRVFGDGGVYGERYEEERSSNRDNSLYDEYEVPQSNKSSRKPSGKVPTTTSKPAEVDLFGLDQPLSTMATTNNNNDDDDDFDDFQSAAPTVQSTPAPAGTLTSDALADLFNSPPATTTTSTTFSPMTMSNNMTPLNNLGNMYNNGINTQPQMFSAPINTQPNYTPMTNTTPAVAPAAKKDDVFSSLFAVAAEKTKNGKK